MWVPGKGVKPFEKHPPRTNKKKEVFGRKFDKRKFLFLLLDVKFWLNSCTFFKFYIRKHLIFVKSHCCVGVFSSSMGPRPSSVVE